ncbi:MAG: biotin biosynthesis protein [Magnetococcales bacterium]|nr:biotin biosynthesis protein [Magnetococcales bacterium]HIJ84492.1 methyltransferase [Magnetococcales bacterium]
MSGRSLIRAAFDRAQDYDQQARMQAQIAQKLAQGFNRFDPRSSLVALEVGCGTGFLSRLLLDRLPQTRLHLTDIAPSMMERARINLQAYRQGPKTFTVMDAETPCFNTVFDLITASMVFQWFRRPIESISGLLNLLAPEGQLFFATLGPDTFREWRTLCGNQDIPCGLHHYPGEEFWFDLAARQRMTLELTEEHLMETHSSPMAFLKRLKAIGAETPDPGHVPAPAGRLRRLLVSSDVAKSPFVVTHHLYFGTFINRPKTGQTFQKSHVIS